jgi:hypothetical protein
VGVEKERIKTHVEVKFIVKMIVVSCLMFRIYETNGEKKESKVYEPNKRIECSINKMPALKKKKTFLK